MKKGIGIEDFREVIKEDCYYFDKTNYIEELIKDKTKIKLFAFFCFFGILYMILCLGGHYAILYMQTLRHNRQHDSQGRLPSVLLRRRDAGAESEYNRRCTGKARAGHHGKRQRSSRCRRFRRPSDGSRSLYSVDRDRNRTGRPA